MNLMLYQLIKEFQIFLLAINNLLVYFISKDK